MRLLKKESFDAFLTSGYDSSTSRHKQGISVRTLISKREQQYVRTTYRRRRSRRYDTGVTRCPRNDTSFCVGPQLNPPGKRHKHTKLLMSRLSKATSRLHA